MRIVLYTHSLVSDWNHGNAHFLRGVLRELEARGHHTLALEPEGGWSRSNLVADRGHAAINRFATDFPELTALSYGSDFDHAAAVDDADLVLVHEWTDPAIIAELGALRRDSGRFTLVFHDTHHRAVSEQAAIADLRLAEYDLILAFGETLRQRYLQRGWGSQVFTWHEAADARLFKPEPGVAKTEDLVWIGNWGDGERANELREFLFEPARQLALTGNIYGVRYPEQALAQLAASGLAYGGSIANADAPAAFARHKMTMHVPRRPYVEALPGIPTIRVFEALACGIPLVSATWHDCEGLFQPGQDYLVARNAAEAAEHLALIRNDAAAAASLAESGRQRILARHTCAHRVDELLAILDAHGRTKPVRLQLETSR
jgi:spore maturation protein CgeB